MTVFHTSDTHFGHERIIELCDRPFSSVDDMNETMIDNWNSVVGPDDTVIHHGDVALGPWKEWDSILTRLNGQKGLVVGNHDRIFAGMKQKEQDRFLPEYSKWFDIIWPNQDMYFLVDGNSIETNFSNTIDVGLSHFPYDGDSHGEDRHAEYRLPDEGQILIHGHTHSTEKVSRSKAGTLQIHVGVDAHNYFPVPESEIVRLIKENI